MRGEMRTCEKCNGDKMLQEEYQLEGETYYEDEIISGVVEECWFCEGVGEVEDICYCSAYCVCECCCGYYRGNQVCYCWDYE